MIRCAGCNARLNPSEDDAGHPQHVWRVDGTTAPLCHQCFRDAAAALQEAR